MTSDLNTPSNAESKLFCAQQERVILPPHISRMPQPQISCEYVLWWEAGPDNLEAVAKVYPELRSGGLALDCGCGSARFRETITDFGFQYIGIDLPGSAASINADAIATPFADATFDFTISWAVLEHLPQPWHAVGELARVTKPGSLLLGAVAFLEPFHESYFHMSRWGINEILVANGFQLERMWPHWHLISSFSLMYRPWLTGRAIKLWRPIAPFLVKTLHRYRMSRYVRYQLPPDTRDHPQAAAMDYLTYSADIAFIARRTR